MGNINEAEKLKKDLNELDLEELKINKDLYNIQLEINKIVSTKDKAKLKKNYIQIIDRRIQFLEELEQKKKVNGKGSGKINQNNLSNQSPPICTQNYEDNIFLKGTTNNQILTTADKKGTTPRGKDGHFLSPQTDIQGNDEPIEFANLDENLNINELTKKKYSLEQLSNPGQMFIKNNSVDDKVISCLEVDLNGKENFFPEEKISDILNGCNSVESSSENPSALINNSERHPRTINNDNINEDSESSNFFVCRNNANQKKNLIDGDSNNTNNKNNDVLYNQNFEYNYNYNHQPNDNNTQDQNEDVKEKENIKVIHRRPLKDTRNKSYFILEDSVSSVSGKQK